MLPLITVVLGHQPLLNRIVAGGALCSAAAATVAYVVSGRALVQIEEVMVHSSLLASAPGLAAAHERARLWRGLSVAVLTLSVVLFVACLVGLFLGLRPHAG
jgi:hypothetical protein